MNPHRHSCFCQQSSRLFKPELQSYSLYPCGPKKAASTFSEIRHDKRLGFERRGRARPKTFCCKDNGWTDRCVLHSDHAGAEQIRLEARVDRFLKSFRSLFRRATRQACVGPYSPGLRLPGQACEMRFCSMDTCPRRLVVLLSATQESIPSKKNEPSIVISNHFLPSLSFSGEIHSVCIHILRRMFVQ